MSRRDSDDEELDALLAELGSTLDALREELRREESDRGGERDASGGRGRRDDRRRPPRSSRSPRSTVPRRGPRSRDYGLPRPPTPGDLLRFTSDYTIPTVIATLEATVEALELLRRFLQLAGGLDPDGRVSDRRSGPTGSRLADGLADELSGAGTRAASDATDALSTLRRVLSEADLPEEGESRDLIDEVRELSAELDRRVAEANESADRERERERRENRSRRSGGSGSSDDDGAVVIDVTDAEDDGDGANGSDDEGNETEDDGDAPEVDVDAELDSIRRELGRGDGEEGTSADDGDSDGGGEDGPDDGRSGGSGGG